VILSIDKIDSPATQSAIFFVVPSANDTRIFALKQANMAIFKQPFKNKVYGIVKMTIYMIMPLL